MCLFHRIKTDTYFGKYIPYCIYIDVWTENLFDWDIYVEFELHDLKAFISPTES